MKVQVPDPYKTGNKVVPTVLCIVMFKLLSIREGRTGF